MNTGGVIKGGLLAGLILNVGEMILNGALLAEQWQAIETRLGMGNEGGVIAFYVVGAFAIGLVGVWLYAAARPRLGAGPATAIQIGLVLWLLGWVMPTLPMMIGGVFPAGMALIALFWGLVEVPLAVVAGAWLYKEEGAPAA